VTAVFRVQDQEGRGPFKPGFSLQWIDKNRDQHQQDIISEFGWRCLKDVPKGMHSGCGFFSMGQLLKWFTDVELERLYLMEYRIVRLTGCTVIRRSANQLIFYRKKPLKLDAESWHEVYREMTP
jgi:hypothetical protein